ncbi:hypothetical protein B1694_08285 [Geobacillus zalihae]|uniref:hypothetical protein n=1 Tax=Geobacillus TaxID=129337 RepID=UPI0003460BF8|nr:MULTISPECIES: hypothetical protein [Geobacillus]EPR26647.1 hypothetical protein I656_03710 [Geobacillus sp. WSUCF1]OQP23609.1 hypothetical protein B1694_08285 [Geobacillus zalihae]
MKAKKQSSSPFSVSILSAIQPSIWKKWIWESPAKGEHPEPMQGKKQSTERSSHKHWNASPSFTAARSESSGMMLVDILPITVDILAK